MNQTDKKLYELLGDKTLSFGCKIDSYEFGVCDYVRTDGRKMMMIDRFDDVVYDDGGFFEIGQEPTSTDLFKWMMDNDSAYATLWLWDDCLIFYGEGIGRERVKIPFDLSKKLIDQSEETKLAIIKLIESYARE